MTTFNYYGLEYNVFTVRAFGMVYFVIVVEERYENNTLALEVLTLEKIGDNTYDVGDTFGILTVNIPGESNSETGAFIKTYSENEGWAEKLAEDIGGIRTDINAETGLVYSVPFYDFSQMHIYAN